MAGSRPLDDVEILNALRVCVGRFAMRDRLLIVMGRYAGFRLREMLSIRIGDVMEGSGLARYLTIRKRYLKGGSPRVLEDGEARPSRIGSRTVQVNPKLADALNRWLAVMREELGWMERSAFLFQSRTSTNRALSTRQAARRLEDIFRRAHIAGPVSSHSLRKSFAVDVHQRLGGDLLLTQDVLGHRVTSSTISYLQLDRSRIDAAVMAM